MTLVLKNDLSCIMLVHRKWYKIQTFRMQSTVIVIEENTSVCYLYAKYPQTCIITAY